MVRSLLPLLAVTLSLLNGQAPTATAKGSSRVTYVAAGESALRAIIAVGKKSQVPIGIIEGRQHTRLCDGKQNYELVDASPKDALDEIAGRSGYSLVERNGVYTLVAPDLAEWQAKMLEFHFTNYPAAKDERVVSLGIRLTMWIELSIGNAQGFGSSELHSRETRTHSLPGMNSASIEDVADQIVRLPGGGIWMLRPSVQNPKDAKDEEVEIRSYVDDPPNLAALDCGPPGAQ